LEPRVILEVNLGHEALLNLGLEARKKIEGCSGGFVVGKVGEGTLETRGKVIHRGFLAKGLEVLSGLELGVKGT
jgi:hypothetical protein